MVSGAGLDTIGARSVQWRFEGKALPLGRCLPADLGGPCGSGCIGWRSEILGSPQVCCQSALLGSLDGAESRFLWRVQTCLDGDLGRPLAWGLDGAFGVLDQTSADEGHCRVGAFPVISPDRGPTGEIWIPEGFPLRCLGECGHVWML